MLRETRAKWAAIATAIVVVLLAAGFSSLRNEPRPEPPPDPLAQADTKKTDAAGRRAFERLNCSMCHSIAGRGNPDSPLDGVGKRLDRTALRDWTTGTGPAQDKLPASIARRKARAADDRDLDALIDYLAGLK